jgi:hypothetical protein
MNPVVQDSFLGAAVVCRLSLAESNKVGSFSLTDCDKHSLVKRFNCEQNYLYGFKTFFKKSDCFFFKLDCVEWTLPNWGVGRPSVVRILLA